MNEKKTKLGAIGNVQAHLPKIKINMNKKNCLTPFHQCLVCASALLICIHTHTVLY